MMTVLKLLTTKTVQWLLMLQARTAKMQNWLLGHPTTAAQSIGLIAALIIGATNGRGDLLKGSSKADTIWAGINDTVQGGGGADDIYIQGRSDSEADEYGAMVALASGKATVHGWNKDANGADIDAFNAEAGANMIYSANGAQDIDFKANGSGVVAAYAGSDSLFFADSADEDAWNMLVGTSEEDADRVTFIKKKKAVEVTSDDELADYYISAGNGSVTFGAGIETILAVDLDSDGFENINYVEVSNNNTAIVYGSSSKDTVVVTGNLDDTSGDGAHKTVSLGGGNDMITSNGVNSLAAGNTFFFGSGDGTDTIKSFGFYASADSEDSADVVVVDTFADLKASKSKKTVTVGMSSGDSVVIANANQDSIVQVAIGNQDNIYKAKVGNGLGKTNFTYSDVDGVLYYGDASAKNTLTASGSDDVGIWLTNSLANDARFKDSKGNTYLNVDYVDASTMVDASATIVGSDNANNTLKGAGLNSQSTLWGGMGGSNSLVGGAGDDTFLFFKGFGNNDTVSACGDAEGTEDSIWLANVSLGDITGGELTSSKVVLEINDGSKITATNLASKTAFTLADGNTWTYVSSTQTWE